MIDDLITLDLDGDGMDESLQMINEDGSTSILSDYNGDGEYEQMINLAGEDYWGNPTEVQVLVDTDNNGIYDFGVIEQMDEQGQLVAHIEVNDYNQDGELDMMKTYQDTDGDGLFDIVETVHAGEPGSGVLQTVDTNVDLTGDQNPDMSAHVEVLDLDGNGEPDMVNLSYTDVDGQSYECQMTYEEYMTADGNPGYSTSIMGVQEEYRPQFDPETADPDLVSGDPASDMERWECQGQTQRCALYAQKFVIEEALDREIPIEELVEVATENGWFQESSGTMALNMDKMLEYYGVEHEMSFNNDIDALEQALRDGDNVIVSLDSDQVWYDVDNNVFSPEMRGDHAVQVIGIDRTDPDNPMVVLNDSGSTHGCGEMVPLEVFEEAWGAADHQMIVAQA